ncbi:MAG: general secretion pathway protein GspF [Proteobacteria bacterium]|nr:general secretion pathway protein GspF [Pseudomonadota bacterium]
MRNKTPRALGLDQPIRHEQTHKRPVTRRDFLAQGFSSGLATIAAPTVFSLFADPRAAQAALSPDLIALKASCGLDVAGAGKIPFICIDLAGGANMVGSNVLIGGPGGQLDFLSTEGYGKLGLPGDMLPGMTNVTTGTSFTDSRLGLAFHSDSAFLRGILDRIAPATAASINGAVIAARSENDTGNNPHNPMYGIHQAGADGALATLIGSRPSDSGGNSMAPAGLIDLSVRPTKVDRASDVTSLVDTGQLASLLSLDDTVAVMEAIQRISARKLQKVDPKQPWADPKQTTVTRNEVVKELVNCGYVKAADAVDQYGDPSSLNPDLDPDIVGAGGIFSRAEYDGDAEFRKTAAVMKMVLSGYAGAGTIALGGYDYHGQGRATGELRDLRAGRCMGACLEYAARRGMPLMLYVFSDGSISASGQVDDTADGRGKFMWTSDNQATAASFFLVYNPRGRPDLITTGTGGAARHQQIGYFRADASVETASSPAAANVNLLVETVVLNYMALHGEQAQFAARFPRNGLGNAALQDSLIAFNPIVSGRIG